MVFGPIRLFVTPLLQEDQDLRQEGQGHPTHCSEEDEEEEENKLHPHNNIHCVFCLLGPPQHPQRDYKHRKSIQGGSYYNDYNKKYFGRQSLHMWWPIEF